MPLELIFLIITIAFLATFVKSAFGFGEGLVSMALLSFVVGLDFSIPFVALTSFCSSLFIMLRDRKDIHFASVKMLLLGALFFAPLGIFAADLLDEKLLRKTLGILITLYAIYSLLQPDLKEIEDKRGLWAVLSGAAGGFLGGAYNIAGPPVVIYANMRVYKPAVFRATMQGFFTPLSLYVIFGHVYMGNFNQNVGYCLLWALPLMLLGIVIGKWVNQKIENPNRFRRIIFIILVVLGITMLF
jgi:uncharacterized membrane protein YfcA